MVNDDVISGPEGGEGRGRRRHSQPWNRLLPPLPAVCLGALKLELCSPSNRYVDVRPRRRIATASGKEGLVRGVDDRAALSLEVSDGHEEVVPTPESTGVIGRPHVARQSDEVLPQILKVRRPSPR